MNGKNYAGIFIVFILGITLAFACNAKAADSNWWKKAAEPYKGTTISVLVNFHSQIDASRQIVKEFEELTGIKTDVEYLVRRQMDIKGETELAANSRAYDVMHIGLWKTARYSKRDWAEPLQQYVNNPKLTAPDFDPEDYARVGIASLTDKNGKILGLPWSLEGIVYYYRSDVFAKHGIKEFPKTLADFEQVCAKIHSKKMPAVVFRGVRGYGINMWTFGPYLRGFGGTYFDDNMNPTINTPEWIEASNWYSEMLTKFGPKGAGAYKHYDMVQDFTQGRVAMFEDGASWISVLNNPEKSTVIGKFKPALPPKSPKNYVLGHYTHGYMIPKMAKHKEAAWLFIQYFTNKDSQRKRALDHGGAAVTRKSVLEDPEYAAKYGEWGKVNAKSLALAGKDVYFLPWYLPEWKEIGDTMGIALQNIIIGEQTPEEAWKDCQGKVYKIVKDAGYIGKSKKQLMPF
jgi:ABC-type glycerol-3-phosphate transport system substrate-binding protein